MASDTVVAVFYGLAFSSILGTFVYDYNYGSEFRLGYYATRFLYLTMVDFAIQCLYMLMGVIRLATGRKYRNAYHDHDSKLARVHDFLHGAIAFPLAWGVVCAFWILYFIDPDLVINEAAKPFLAIKWFNHMLHTAPGVFILIDTVLVCHKCPSRRKAVPAIAIFSVVYVSMILLVHRLSGFWAYPVLEVLGTFQRGLFILAIFLLIMSLYLVGSLVNGFVWGDRMHVGEVKVLKKKFR